MSSGIHAEESPGPGNINTGDSPHGLLPVSAPASLTNSQTSSFNDSLASQTSDPRSSKETSQSSAHNQSKRDGIPSASSTLLFTSGRQNPDVGNQSSKILQNVSLVDLQSGDPHPRSKLPRLSVQSTAPGEYRDDNGHGQKRTATGELKSAGTSLPTSPVDAVRQGHSRNTSVNSNGSQMGELSAQLRTRLSYAMVKVQNGWQSRSIDEVENLASQQTSHASIVSASRAPQNLPLAEMLNYHTDRAGFAQSSERTTASPASPANCLPHMHNGTSGLDHAYQHNTVAYSPPPYPTRSLQDSLWQDQTKMPISRPSTNSRSQAPSLAPPIDMYPRNPRRSNASQPQPPPLRTNGLQDASIPSASPTTSSTAIPSTPPPKLTPAIKTPSQKATAMEKDAIETLLFMSSPGNTQYHATNSQMPPTPLRNRFAASEKRVGFASDEFAHGLTPVKRRSLLESANLADDEDIDKLLDQMPDGESSSDDDMGLKPRRRAPANI